MVGYISSDHIPRIYWLVTRGFLQFNILVIAELTGWIEDPCTNRNIRAKIQERASFIKNHNQLI